MKRVFELLLQAAIVVAFVVCVELFLRRRRRRKRMPELPVSITPPARLRVRHGGDRARVTFGIEGNLDEFSARMLACSVAQLRHSTTAILDLSEAGPISGRALSIFEGILAASRRIQVRGLRKDHVGLVDLHPVRGVRGSVVPVGPACGSS
jgi:hypothetical protein